ncbi:DUF3168 domain-containing protein [Faunimonas sp. B44]|uniref:DUF3168 domain-containing protein n=1 Tax=Faunimonas sp. B44 TaxID=3461493 RepID=UPI004044F658
MSGSPVLALQKAVFEALSGDASLGALLGGPRIHDAVPRNPAAPYVHLGETVWRDWSTATEGGAEIRLAVTAVTKGEGRSEALAIAERVRVLLHEAPLAPAGHRLVNLRHLATTTRTSRDRAERRAELTFRAVMEPAS